MSLKAHNVKKRQEQYVDKTSTKIWKEEPSPDNPYLAARHLCHGYDHMELLKHRSFVDVFFLLFRGELPSSEQSMLLEKLMISYINPGPRHPAAQAAMNAALSKTQNAHIVPIATSINSGSHMGATEVEQAMRFIHSNLYKDIKLVVKELLDKATPPKEGDWHIASGFGSRFGSIDRYQTTIINELLKASKSTNDHMQWAINFSKEIHKKNQGLLAPGVIAAALCDLGFHPREGAGIYQIISAPGLFAHGIEMANKPLTAMPFLDDEHYILESHD